MKKRVVLGLRFRLTLAVAVFVLVIMGMVIEFVRRQQSDMLAREVRQRGMALAGAVAANSAEPLALGEETALLLMQQVQGVIQISSDPEAKRDLLSSTGLVPLVLEELKALGRPKVSAEVQNEGVVFAKVVDPTGAVLAAADVFGEQADWVNELGTPYKPDPGTGVLAPGEAGRVWETPVRGGMFVVGAPILGGASGSGAVTIAEEGETAAAPATLGAVYLGVSKSLVGRAIAVAVSKLLLVLGGGLIFGVLVTIVIVNRLVKPIRLLYDAVIAVGGGNFNQRVTIERRDELGELAISFNDMARGLAEREIIRNAFGAYVSQDLLSDILDNPEAMKIGGVKRTITLVDSDVRGFTSMSTTLPPEEVVTVINAYLDLQTRIVREYRGHIDRFVGDEVLAAFGVPDEAPDDAQRAVKCAWAIRQAVAKMVFERVAQGLPAPRIGIGVDTGTVVAGNMGAQGVKLEYAIVGQPMSTAHELVDAARDPRVPGGQVILSEATYRKVKDMVEVRELGTLDLPGSSTGVKIYDLVGVKS